MEKKSAGLIKIFFLFLTILVLFSCSSSTDLSLQKNLPAQEHFEISLAPEKTFEVPKPLVLNLAGDIMAHHVNYRMKDFSLIYADIVEILAAADFSFVNMETPVDESRAYTTYPNFCVKEAYVDAAANAGFNVFSAANNHTNDQSLSGVIATRNYYLKKREQGVYGSGIREKEEDKIAFEVLEKNGWKILYVAVTEFFNRHGHGGELVNHIPAEKKSREEFAALISRTRAEIQADLCVVSVHVNEPEYERTVSQKRKDYFKSLLDAGVDIICASHPHVMQEWEIYQNEEGKNRKLIAYSMGNLVSGQRYTPNRDKPEGNWEYTGDAYILQITAKKEKGLELEITPFLITNYVDSQKNVLIKQLHQNFIDFLPEQMKPYYTRRRELMEKIQGKIINEKKQLATAGL